MVSPSNPLILSLSKEARTQTQPGRPSPKMYPENPKMSPTIPLSPKTNPVTDAQMGENE